MRQTTQTLAEAQEQARKELEKSGKGLLMVKHSRARHLQMMRVLEPQPPKIARVRSIR